MHVVLAGGGTAGHVEPALNLADCLRRHDPDVGITALGTERGLETRLVPERGYDLAPHHGRAAAAPAHPRPRAAARARAPVGRARSRDVLDEHRRRRRGRLRRLRRAARLPRRARPRCPIVIHEANARPGLANRSAPGSRRTSAAPCPTRSPRSRHIGMPLRRAIATLDRAGAARRGARGLRPRPRPPDAAGLRRLAGRPSAQRRGRGRGRAGLTAQGIQVLHAVGLRNDDQRPPGATGPAPYVARALPRPHGPRLRRGRRRALPRRAR